MNRREFIKTGAGAFFIAAAGSAFGAGAPSNRVRLAIVGCHAKGRGFTVMQNALKVPGVEIPVVCDVDARAREAAAAKLKELTGKERSRRARPAPSSGRATTRPAGRWRKRRGIGNQF